MREPMNEHDYRDMINRFNSMSQPLDKYLVLEEFLEDCFKRGVSEAIDTCSVEVFGRIYSILGSLYQVINAAESLEMQGFYWQHDLYPEDADTLIRKHGFYTETIGSMEVGETRELKVNSRAALYMAAKYNSFKIRTRAVPGKDNTFTVIRVQ